MTVPDATPGDVTALGTLLAGEVDGAVDELAAYILASSWLAQRDARVRAEALREYADALAHNESAAHWPTVDDFVGDVRDWANTIEREALP